MISKTDSNLSDIIPVYGEKEALMVKELSSEEVDYPGSNPGLGLVGLSFMTYQPS